MGTNRVVYIRTDGNRKIASGHLVRCLSIAQKCPEKQTKVCFLLSDEESRQVLHSFLSAHQRTNPNLSVLVLQTAVYNDLEQELPEIIALLKATPDCVFLLDSYFVTKHYLSVLSQYTKLVYLDDLQLFDYPVDLLINYDVIPSRNMPTYQMAYQKAKKTLLGASYAPLRSQFENTPSPVREQISNILITTGGSDPCHFCVEILNSFATMYENEITHTLIPNSTFPTVHIVVGKMNEDKALLYSMAENLSFAVLHENVADMASLMSSCDLAVSASGTTLYELCALGIPAISFTMANNQLITAKAFSDVGAIICAGDIRTNMNVTIKQIFSIINQMSTVEARKKAHQTMRNLVDGNGATRIMTELLNL